MNGEIFSKKGMDVDVFEDNQTPQPSNDGFVTVSKGTSSKKNKKGAAASGSGGTVNVAKKFQQFITGARASKNNIYDPSPLFHSISHL